MPEHGHGLLLQLTFAGLSSSDQQRALNNNNNNAWRVRCPPYGQDAESCHEVAPSRLARWAFWMHVHCLSTFRRNVWLLWRTRATSHYRFNVGKCLINLLPDRIYLNVVIKCDSRGGSADKTYALPSTSHKTETIEW